MGISSDSPSRIHLIKMRNKKYDLFPTMSDYVGCRLIFFLSVVDLFFSRFVGSQLYFRRLSLVG